MLKALIAYSPQEYNPELENTAHRVLDSGDPKVSVYLQGFPRDQADLGTIYTHQIRTLFRHHSQYLRDSSSITGGGGVSAPFSFS